MKTVTIIQRVLPHYRIPFFLKLKDDLMASGVNLKLIYGQEYPGSVPKTAPIDAPWAFRIQNAYRKVLGCELVWQPCLQHLKGADLIIFEQANRLLLNYLLLARMVGKGARIGYWGHGKNFQAKSGGSVKERLKRLLLDKVDWWFAYTDLTATILNAGGFPGTKISVVRNSIDTDQMVADCAGINTEMLLEKKNGLGIESDNIAIYCGGMYADKKLDFLIEACALIRGKVADFQMVFIGDGPLQQLVAAASETYPWLHYVGPKFGREKALYLKLAKALLMPGLVGLVVIDSFVSGVPLITTEIDYHSPEIDYLTDGVNGLVTTSDVNSFAAAVAGLLDSPAQQESLRRGCASSAQLYTIDNMVGNFSAGVRACLNIG